MSITGYVIETVSDDITCVCRDCYDDNLCLFLPLVNCIITSDLVPPVTLPICFLCGNEIDTDYDDTDYDDIDTDKINKINREGIMDVGESDNNKRKMDGYRVSTLLRNRNGMARSRRSCFMP